MTLTLTNSAQCKYKKKVLEQFGNGFSPRLSSFLQKKSGLYHFGSSHFFFVCFSQCNTKCSVSVLNDTTLNGLVKTLEMAIKSYKTLAATPK